nr:hypothetical protein [uncultured Arsenicibacter sp.]
MKVHILSAFPGSSAGKTKEIDDITAKELIAKKWAIEAKEGVEHPEPEEAPSDKTDKAATGKTNKGGK